MGLGMWLCDCSKSALMLKFLLFLDMQASPELSEFGKILLFMLLGVSFILLGMAVNAFLKKKNPNDIKNSTYECGEVTEGPSRTPFNMRFYMIAIIFLLFDVELVFLFPWSTIFADKTLLATVPHWAAINIIEMSVFIAILLLGLAYVWKKGDLEWIRPTIITPTTSANIPQHLYESINQLHYTVREFKLEEKPVVAEPVVAASTAAPGTVRRPPFRSAVKKESNE
jgi:NADH-quinone oxidoreductase subunit A